MKFRLDWYMVCLSLKKSKSGLILAGGQENACLKSMKMTTKKTIQLSDQLYRERQFSKRKNVNMQYPTFEEITHEIFAFTPRASRNLATAHIDGKISCPYILLRIS